MPGLSRLVASRQVPTWARCFSTTSSAKGGVFVPWDGSVPDYIKENNKNKRLGYGRGLPAYSGHPSVPAEAVRFQEDSKFVTEVCRPKEKGHWSELTLEEKKALYRTAYQMTVSETEQEDYGRWKVDAIFVIWTMTLGTLWSMWILDHSTPIPFTQEEEWRARRWNNFVASHNISYSGLFDYEKNENRKRGFFEKLS